MRAAYMAIVLLLVGCTHVAPESRIQTPTQRAGAALAASQECGGRLSERSNNDAALAVAQDGIGAVKAAEYSYHALWVQMGESGPEHDQMCAMAYKNGWIQ